MLEKHSTKWAILSVCVFVNLTFCAELHTHIEIFVHVYICVECFH